MFTIRLLSSVCEAKAHTFLFVVSAGECRRRPRAACTRTCRFSFMIIRYSLEKKMGMGASARFSPQDALNRPCCVHWRV